MRISAKADYAVRAAAELAASPDGAPRTAEDLAATQQVPRKFLEAILTALRGAGLVVSQRGLGGGYRLARPADEVSVADVVRAVDGPLVFVRGERPSELDYQGAAAPLLHVWVALRANVRHVLESVTLADLAGNNLPAEVQNLLAHEAAWESPESLRGQ
ncbi:Rrf2 family transcriptional regulator [Demequina sp. NBRC 110057]|uniref:RrF2 family transcriptional regulator n=1 Tax=Demequina sp. NBRC 110057 TaxID=1570346 RepID=UPI0009FE6946|nr:Rrf2 family transcriptional regulator [Demequina sp. NBRC 110057]